MYTLLFLCIGAAPIDSSRPAAVHGDCRDFAARISDSVAQSFNGCSVPLEHASFGDDLALMSFIEGDLKHAPRITDEPRCVLLAAAYETLHRLDQQKCWKILRQELRSPVSGTRALAAIAAGRTQRGNRSAIAAVKFAMADENRFVRLYAGEAYWKLTGEVATVLPLYCQSLDSEDPQTASLAALLLAEVGRPAKNSLHLLCMRASQSPDLTVRAQSLYAIGMIGRSTPEVRATLTRSINDPANRGKVRVRVNEEGKIGFDRVEVSKFARSALLTIGIE